jgi:ABC-type branched-subunit amino acid transport system substrate-binding protein
VNHGAVGLIADAGGCEVSKARRCVPLLAVAALTVATTATACSRSSGTSKSSSSTAPSAAAVGAGDFGSLKAVCGPGDAKGATDVGVTDTTIRVGTMADPGATAQPGLDQELFDTAEAFVKWCNAAGGILGRTLQLDKWDSKLTEVAARMIQACPVDLSLVGNGEAFDSAGVDQRTKCKLPEVAGYVVSSQASHAPLSIQAIPASDHQSGLGGALRLLKAADPSIVGHVGQLSSQLQSVKDAGDRDRAAIKQLGFTEVYYDEAPVLVDNWRPYAQNLQTKGVQLFTIVNAPDNLAALYRSLSDVGYYPKYALLPANMYDTKLTKGAGTALKGNVLVVTNAVPFELASTHPATKQYLDILAKYVPGAQPKALGINGFSSWLLFATAAKECGSQLTRTCLLDKARAVTDWNGGGLHAPTHPGTASSSFSPCFLLMRATATGFVYDKALTKPTNDIFNCDPKNVFDLPGFGK